MQSKQKLAYMALGSLFTLAGYLLASLVDDVKGQSDEQSVKFDEISCHSLKVVDEDNGTYVQMGVDANGGSVYVFGKKHGLASVKVVGKEGTEAAIGIDERIGIIESKVRLTTGDLWATTQINTIKHEKGIEKHIGVMRLESGKGVEASMFLYDEAGSIGVRNKEYVSAFMNIDENGSLVKVEGKDTGEGKYGFGSVTMTADNFGSSGIRIKDKNGYRDLGP